MARKTLSPAEFDALYDLQPDGTYKKLPEASNTPKDMPTLGDSATLVFPPGGQHLESIREQFKQWEEWMDCPVEKM
jgi:hypothetical protein